MSAASPISQVFGVGWVWTPNAQWVNELRFSYNWFSEAIAPLDANVNPQTYGINTGVTDPRLFGFPRINPGSETFNYLGGNSSWPLSTLPSQTENISDTVSVNKGRHNLRFGGDYRYGSVKYYRATEGRGRVDFDTLEDFVAGNAALLKRSLVQQVGPAELLQGTEDALTSKDYEKMRSEMGKYPIDMQVAVDNLKRAQQHGAGVG